MAENYVVNYDINVRSQAALQALDSFQRATNKLSQAGKQLVAFQKKIEAVTSKLNQMARKAPVLDIATSKANKKLDATIAKLEKIHRLAKQTAALNVSQGPAPAGTVSRSNTNVSTTSSKQTSKGSKAPASSRRSTIIPSNIGYRVLGPSMIDSGGVGALDFMKGMGIAYGISGLGSLMSNTLKEAVEYDNLMQTTKNILKTHDKLPNFDSRFENMSHTIRNVGVETKFTSQQVADAGKFLAMAGFDIDAINQSIRPIADIALVGDTDLGETADVVTNIMTGYGIAPGRVRKAADVMTMTFTKSNTTLLEMAEAYKYAASLLAMNGTSFEEATAALGILGDAGIKGSQAGTTMRTIALNIAKPTKQQAKVWEQLGIERLDENGNVRDLYSIFRDLQEKNLSLSQLGSIFHKTAAMGAGALIEHVDKWNEIIELNFMSDGLVAKLAEEKKNTVAGLWAQLTSAFTENGLQAFEDLQEPIKGFLKEIIGWLMSEEAAKMMKSLASTVFDLIKMLMEFTKIFMFIYEHFGGFIKGWLKLQLVLTSIIVPLRIVKSLFNVFAFAFVGAKNIGLLTANLRHLFTTIKQGKGVQGVLQGALGGFYQPNISEIAFQRGYSDEVARRYNRMVYNRSRGSVPSMWKTVGSGIGAMAGGTLGSIAGSYIGEEGSGLSAISSIVGGIGGTLLGGYATTLLPMLFTNPVGWGVLAVGAVGGVIYGICSARDAMQQGHEKAQAWIKDFNDLSIAGIDVAKQFGLIEANMRISASFLPSEQKDKLRRQAFSMWYNNQNTGEDKPDMDEDYLKLKHSQKFKDDLAIADQYYGKWEYFGDILTNLPQFSTSPKILAGEEYKDYWFNDKILWYNQPKDGKDSMNENEALQIALLLEGMNRNSPIHQRFQDLARNQIYGISRSQDINSVWGRLYDDALPEHSYMYTDKSTEDFENASVQMVMESWHWQQGARAIFDEVKREYADWTNLISQYDQGIEVSVEETQKVLYNALGLLFDPKNGVFGTQEFTTKIQEIVKNPEANGYASEKEAIAAVTKTFTDLLDFFNLLDVHYKPLFAQYLNRNIWSSFLPAEYTLPEGGFVGGKDKNKKTWINGVAYEWKELGVPYAPGSYGWVDKDGKPYIPTDSKTIQQTNVAPGSGGNGGGTGGTGGTGGGSADYKSHYSNHSAAPKQVIVKIENLMNVESVDLSNPDNAAVIADLKGQLTQALVDVVHDFDETYHG